MNVQEPLPYTVGRCWHCRSLICTAVVHINEGSNIIVYTAVSYVIACHLSLFQAIVTPSFASNSMLPILFVNVFGFVRNFGLILKGKTKANNVPHFSPFPFCNKMTEITYLFFMVPNQPCGQFLIYTQPTRQNLYKL